MADYDYVLTTGTVVPETSNVLSDVEQEYKDIYGDDFVTDSETPQGAMIAAETTSRISVLRNNAKVANQLNPRLSGGTFFDAIWSLTDGERTPATYSTDTLLLTGVAGTTVPEGSLASDSSGVEWESQSEIVIGASGTATGIFQATEPGAISAPAGTITTIVDNSVLGWETVTNPSAASQGADTQSDTSARKQRKNELALQGRSTALAVKSNVSNVDGVTSLSFRENVANTTQEIDGVTMIANSIWAAVDGGADSDIAAQLLEAKSSGSAWNGSITVDVTESASGQVFPVKFDRPTDIDLMLRITINSGTGTNPASEVKSAVIDYVNGESEVGDGFVVGKDVSPYEIAAAINYDTPSVYVRNVEIAELSETPTYTTGTYTIEIYEIARLLSENIEVVLS